MAILRALVSVALGCTLVVAACAPGTATPPPGSTPASSGLAGSGAPTPSAPTPPAAKLPPSDFADLIVDRVEAGKWTLEEGLLAVLRLLAGEVAPGQVPEADRIVRGEATGAIRLARQYVAAPADGAAATEIERLLARIVPTRAELDAVSAPFPGRTTSRGGFGAIGLPGPAEPARHDVGDRSAAVRGSSGRVRTAFVPRGCESIPAPSGTADEGICYHWADGRGGGATIRVYFPIAMELDASKLAYFDRALQGVEKAFDTYAGLGLTLGDTYVVFSATEPPPEPGDEHPESLADADDQGEDCGIVVYPQALVEYADDPSPHDKFRQILAHEAFHCAQFWNWQSRWELPDGVTQWWIEGTAEYFSNVVYPKADSEDDWLEAAGALPDLGLLKRDYDNVYFFQHLANEGGGPETVLDVIRATPESGDLLAQRDALAAFPEIDDLFHGYGKALLDGAIQDLDDAPFPIQPAYGDTFAVTEVGAIAAFDTIPFAVHRYPASFTTGHTFKLTSGVEGDGQQAARVDLGTGWAGPPEQVVTGCSDLPYIWLVTSTQGSVTHKSEVTAVTDVDCDRCLVGEWQLDNATYESYLPPREGLELDEITGRMWITYNDSGGFAGGFDRFAVAFSQETRDFDGNPVVQTVELVFEGSASGVYAAGGGILTYADSDYDFASKVRVVFDGKELAVTDVPFSRRSFPVFEGVTLGYSCTDSELRFKSPVEGVNLQALVFRRTSPPTP